MSARGRHAAGAATSRLGRWAARTARHRRLTVTLTLLFLAFAGATSGSVADLLDLGGFTDPASSSARARTVLAEQFDLAQPNLVLLVSAGQQASSPAVSAPDVAAAGQQLTQQLSSTRDIAAAASYWTLGQPAALRNGAGDRALVLATIAGDDKQVQERVAAISERFAGRHGPLQVQVGGAALLARTITDRAERDLVKAEGIILPVVAIALVLVFGGLVAASLPLATAVLSVVGTMLALRTLLLFTDVSFLAMNVATGLGLGLAVDYSLLMVSRYREELARRDDVPAAIAATAATAGRTILFSALTVILALAGLLVFPLYFLRSFAYAGMAVTAFAAFTAVTVLPALLAIVGTRIDRFRVLRRGPTVPPAHGGWYRFAHRVMRRPVLSVVAVLAVLGLLGAPILGLRLDLVNPDPAVLPPAAAEYRTAVRIDREFPQRPQDAVLVVLRDNPGDAPLTGYATRLSALPDVAAVQALTGSFQGGRQVAGPSPASAVHRASGSNATYLAVVPAVDPYSGRAQRLVDRVRAVPAPGAAEIGGVTATFDDTLGALRAGLPLAVAIAVLATVLLLLLLTGSLLVPVKAAVLSLLSLSATFGVMVWGFQDGHLRDLLDFTPTGAITATMPVLVFCIAYGLSMDYEVFLMARIREEYDTNGGHNGEAIAVGLQRTGRLFTAAAGLIAIVFLSFLSSGVQFVKLIGLALAVALILDATLIRAVLVPALMRLAGRANWWLPPPLRRLHARFGVTEPVPVAAAPALSTPWRQS